MKRSVRRSLLLLAALLFAAIAPGIVLFAIGYRPTIIGSQEAIGVLLVDALPHRTEVTVNGQLLGRVPRTVSSLKAGPVNIKLTKPGYINWEKNLAIEPTRATDATGARLFPSEPDVAPLKSGVTNFSISPNRSLLATYHRDGLWQIVDTSARAVSPPIKLSAQPIESLWSPDNGFVVIKNSSGQYFMHDIAGDIDQLTPLPALAGAVQIIWDLRVPGRLLALSKDGVLSSLNIVDQQHFPLLNNVRSFALGSRQIIVVTKTGSLELYSPQGQLIRVVNAKLEKVPARLLVTPAGDTAIIFADNQLVLIGEDDEFLPVADQVLEAAWSPDGRMLLVQTNQNELHVYNFDNKAAMHIQMSQLSLIVRLSQPITDPHWYAGGNHVIYQVNDGIIITEIDTRDYPISYTIDTTNMGSAQAAVGEDGNEIFYLKANSGITALYRASLLIEADTD